jgi:hypothetical protein
LVVGGLFLGKREKNKNYPREKEGTSRIVNRERNGRTKKKKKGNKKGSTNVIFLPEMILFRFF